MCRKCFICPEISFDIFQGNIIVNMYIFYSLTVFLGKILQLNLSGHSTAFLQLYYFFQFTEAYIPKILLYFTEYLKICNLLNIFLSHQWVLNPSVRSVQGNKTASLIQTISFLHLFPFSLPHHSRKKSFPNDGSQGYIPKVPFNENNETNIGKNEGEFCYYLKS